MSNSQFIRPLVQNLHAYVPGEQPKMKDLIKLNTNENPYPPSLCFGAAGVGCYKEGRSRV